MKATTSLLACVALVVGTAVTNAQAPKAGKTSAETGAEAKVKAPAKAETKPSTVVVKEAELTGSRIKRSYRKSGTITDGPNQVAILDRDAIEQSGASDLRELLSRRGLRR